MPSKGIDWKTELPNAIAMGKTGKSLVEIGKNYGVSRQRIKQVFAMYGVDPATIGVKIRIKASREAKAAAHFAKWGDEEQDLYALKRLKYHNKRSNAKAKGHIFTVLFSEVEFPTHCPVFGIELDYYAEKMQENSVSFDAVKPELGYVVGNVVVMSWRANRIKNDGTPEEHRRIADFVESL